MFKGKLAAITSGISQGLILWLIMFNVFISNLENETECILGKFVDGTKSEEVIDILGCKAAIQRTGFHTETKGN